MFPRQPWTAAMLVAAVSLAAAPALAHPQLVQATPAAGSTVAPTDRIELRFSEPLVGKFTGATLTATSMMMGGQMMDHEMDIGGVKAAVSPTDPKVLVVTLKQRLAPGGYRLDWHAVSTDTHKVKGQLAFTVR